MEGCPNCGSTSFYVDELRNETVCNNCGFVLGSATEILAERGQLFETVVAREQPSEDALRAEELGRTLRGGSRDAGKKELSQDEVARFRKLERIDNIRTGRSARSLNRARVALGKLLQQLDLPDDFRDRASLFLRRAIEDRVTKGRPIEVVVAACVYLATRALGAPRSLKEISAAADVQMERVAATAKLLARTQGISAPIPRPSDFVARFASQLQLPHRVQVLAMQLASKRIENNGTHSPAGVAAAAIYLAAKLEGAAVRQADIAQVAKVSEVSIRKYAELLEGG